MSKNFVGNRKPGLKLIAYADESGNTGQDLFNDSQPYFWTGALLSPVDMQIAGRKAHQDWQRALGVKELHGSELRLEGIAKIALDLRNFLASNSSSFVISKVEKVYHAGTTLAWVLFDSDFNMAVSPRHDHAPLLKRMLSLAILDFLREKDLKSFWFAYQKRDLHSFATILETLQFRILEIDGDKRMKELLLDALAWGAQNPGEILRNAGDQSDSPNILAVGLLLNGINEHLPELSRVVKFVHDEQSQFGRSIMSEYEKNKNITHMGDHPFLPVRLVRVKNFSCPIEFVSSHTSIGLQIIDVILWLVKRTEERPETPLPENCADLLDYVYARTRRADFTHRLLSERTRRDYESAMSRSLSPEVEARARLLRDQMEMERLKRMSRAQSDRHPQAP